MMKLHQGIQTVKWAIRSLFVRTALCLVGGILLLPGSSQGCFIVGDLSGDCRVGIEDLALAASQWMQASCAAETGLVVHWKLNESGGPAAVDSSGSGYNGTVVGANWNPAGGILGGALQFDGADYVWSSYQGITGSNPRTCAVWIKTDQPSAEIMTWGNRDIDTGRWVVWLDDTGVLSVDVGGGYIFGTTVLTDDLWHHIAVTSDGSTTDNIVLYVDGQTETTGGVVSQSINTQASATTKLGVFQLPNMEGSYFNGLIDDARIYDRALSLQEIWSVAKTATTNYACADLNTDETVNLIDVARMAQDWDDASPIISINEFLADNESKSPLGPGEILDGNGDSSDWIELHNNSEMAVDIGGWYLTDESSLKTMWRFPSGMDQLVLQPGDFLVVFASGKTQAENPGNYPYVDPAGYLHTNFKLPKGGKYLALIHSDGTTPIHEYNHFKLGGGEYGYPEQEEDISYGYYYGQTRYFSEPTPGTDNVKSAFEEFVAKPDVSIKGGCYENAFDVTLSCDTEGAFIRYTTDGTSPSLTNGMDYAGPININSLTTIIAKAFKPGLQRSDARIETYIFVQSAVADFNSNLPIIVVDTLGVTIPQDKINKPWTNCRAVIIDIDDGTGRADITGPEHFEGLGQIRYRGESTYGTKRHFAFETQDEYGQDKDVSLLGMPAESDWVITGERLDYTLLKCEIAFKWFRNMGHYAPRQRYVEMYVNEGGGAISTSDYKGIFMLREKIKRNKNRVDIARLDTSHNLEPKVSGGYILKNDKVNTGDTLLKDYMEKAYYGIAYDGAGKAILEDPGPLEVTQPQIDWITDYINEFHSVLWQNTSSSYYPGPDPDYTDYIDVISFIDHFIVEQIGADADAFWGSYFTHKDRDGKIYSGPPWDFDRGFHNNASKSNSYTVWKSNGAIFGKWHQKLPEYYPDYKLTVADRWFEHREVVTNTALTMAHIDETVALITEAMGRSIAKYGFPGSGGNYAGEIVLFKNWITNRLNWLDGEFASRFAERPPVFSPVGGYVNQGDHLEMSKPSGASGTIYYTLNGEDPRLEGGSINPVAQAYSGPSQIEFNKSTCVKARIKDGGDWSAQNKEVYALGPILENLRISELMYHPTDPTQAEKDAAGDQTLIDEDFEFIEFKNIGTSAINLNLVHFTDGIDFTFGDYSLGAGDFAVVVKNQAAFEARYPGVSPSLIAGTYTGALDNDGEEIVMRDALGAEIHDFDYNDTWFVITDGGGYSLNKLDPDTASNVAPDSWDTQSGWRPGSALNGTPAADDTGYTLQPGDVVISEIMTHTDDLVYGDWIEIWNKTGTPVYIGGWFLSDNELDLMKYEIAAGDPRATIAPDSYVVFDSVNDFRNAGDPGSIVQFGLSEHGEDVYLTSGVGGIVTGEYSTEQENFGAAENGVTLGMYIKGDGSDDFVRLMTITKGYANNNDPVIGPVVISEIMYNPQDPDSDAEYIELKNITGGTVYLYDPANPMNTWQIKGVSYAFPQGITIAANETILITRGDPATFRTTYGISAGI
ncbi:MAG: lamin tail domain-containing protein, partial [Planctomycetes bacterium]|nr:lamin tail domain-containing protein [Planctomycetota bacterium]